WSDPAGPSSDEIYNRTGMMPRFPTGAHHLSFTGGEGGEPREAVLRFDVTATYNDSNHGYGLISGCRYIAEMRVPLQQDSASEGFPEFSITVSSALLPELARPGEGGYGWPAAMQGSAEARRAEAALGRDLPQLQEMAHRAAVDYQARAVENAGECSPAKRLEFALSAPADPAMIGAALKDAFAPLQQSMQPLAAGREDAAGIYAAGHRALIESIDGLADAIRAGKEAVLAGIGGGEDGAWLRAAVESL
ncbi:MAG: hypothetical protein HUK26_09810, partial [Duodenibacillus sp.]|nr:hypothetical protein [Duodenibacillus sp.]